MLAYVEYMLTYVARSLVLLSVCVCVYLVFCTFILFYLLSLYCLFFDLRILIMSLISLSFSHYVRILTGNVMPLATNTHVLTSGLIIPSGTSRQIMTTGKVSPLGTK